MSGLSDLIRVLLEKSWALGTLLLIVGAGAWFAGSHGQRMPEIVLEWAVPGALLGLGLVALSAISSSVSWLRGKVTAARTAKRLKRDEAEEAAANVQTLTPEKLEALSSFIASGATRASVNVDSIVAQICRKGVLRAVRKQEYMNFIVEIPEVILDLALEIEREVAHCRRTGLLR